ncbi:membrane protein [Sorangium cellulosum]|uniref:Probable membrane transporter protein n=1 Tax=Sorangium cellulosum TaxID=56 RepID=A0A2L0ENY5_SORCE|nr:sulfite exporter TauE/SafE family protein [Sorangium cellulosum]AUX40996.1 membrane protein [Sorangium cellulosum]
MDLTGAALLAGGAAVAGAINAVAGGGTLVSFPAAIAAGLAPLAANATNAVALTPASLASAWAYRRELARDAHVLRLLLLPSLLGGAAGSALLLVTPQRVFDAAVPALVLVATLLLFWQNLRPPRPAPAGGAPDGFALPSRPWLVFLLQFLVSVYGGYFGAGIGIMMLALLSSFAGGADIHRMNALKTVLASLINGVAALAFIAAGAVDAVATPIMMVAAIVGSLVGAVVARRIEPRKVRWFVVALGLVLTAKLAWDRFGPSAGAPG